MQDMTLRGRSSGRIAIAALLIIECILGLLFSLPLLADLLVPGRPVIVTGTAILTGPIVGAALAVALASPIIAWGLWMLKGWSSQRTLLLEVISLVIAVLAFTQPEINRVLLFTLISIEVLILLCWYADPSVRAIAYLRQSGTSDIRKQA